MGIEMKSLGIILLILAILLPCRVFSQDQPISRIRLPQVNKAAWSQNGQMVVFYRNNAFRYFRVNDSKKIYKLADWDFGLDDILWLADGVVLFQRYIAWRMGGRYHGYLDFELYGVFSQGTVSKLDQKLLYTSDPRVAYDVTPLTVLPCGYSGYWITKSRQKVGFTHVYLKGGEVKVKYHEIGKDDELDQNLLAEYDSTISPDGQFKLDIVKPNMGYKIYDSADNVVSDLRINLSLKSQDSMQATIRMPIAWNWSPDGDKIAIELITKEGFWETGREIQVIDLKSRETIYASEGPQSHETFGAWSPTSKGFIYYSRKKGCYIATLPDSLE
jgi:hypothetical protein